MKLRLAALLSVGAVMLTACASPANQTLTPAAVEITAATATTAPPATATPPPTATATSAPTVTTKPRATATSRPTAIPATATLAASAIDVPPPQIFQFDAGGFMKYLDYAHKRYQMMLGFVSDALKGAYPGSCNLFNIRRNDLMSIAAFTNVPEQWKAMVDEYHDLRTQAFVVSDPIHQVCKGGGGTINEETARTLANLLDRAQNRMYEMLQQAKTMTQ